MNKSLKLLLKIVFIVSILSSCKDEEFYKKDYLEPIVKNIPIPPAKVTDVDDDGKIPCEAIGNCDDGGGDDGGGDDGGGDDGGGDDGGGDDGGGDDGGGDDGGDPVTLEDVSESFTQEGEQKKIDILWVIDNSGSMSDEQRALGENFDAFIKDFAGKNVDFKMAITTTDTTANNAGKAYKDSIQKLTSDALTNDREGFFDDFESLINVGIRGSGNEKGLKASETFANIYGNSFLRKDAFFTIVYVSDEEDQSEKDVSAHLKQISKWKENAGLIKAYSIVNMDAPSNSGGMHVDHARYKEMSDLTNGHIASIKSDFYTTLLKMGSEIASLTKQFPLSKTPHDASQITVKVNGQAVIGWVYHRDTNSIQFDAAAQVQDGDQVQVSYKTVK